MRIDISNGWKYVDGTVCDEIGIPPEAEEVDLPLDLLRRKNRNYNTALGQYGSYYDAVAATFYRALPHVDRNEWLILEVEGVNQFADLSINGETVAHFEGEGKHFADITEHYRYGAKNILKLTVWAPQMAGKYAGAGIGGGVRIHTHANAAAILWQKKFVARSYGV